MMEITVPDVFYLTWDKENDTKLYRSDPVDVLLKQVLEVLDGCNDQGADDGDGYFDTWKSDELESVISEIKKFLGEPEE